MYVCYAASALYYASAGSESSRLPPLKPSTRFGYTQLHFPRSPSSTMHVPTEWLALSRIASHSLQLAVFATL